MKSNLRISGPAIEVLEGRRAGSSIRSPAATKCRVIPSTMVASVMLMAVTPLLFAGQPLETETARLLGAKVLEMQSVFEFQTAKDGNEFALPLAFEYGITDRLQILVEPVLFSSIHPDGGDSTTGIGDTEATIMYKIADESTFMPALAIATEVKFATASNNRIGSGKTDYTPFIIASKRIGRWDLHANFGYSIIGEPTGVSAENTFNYAVAAEYYASEKWRFVAEVIGNTSALGRAEGATDGESAATSSVDPTESVLAPELGGSETTGMLGVRYVWTPALALSFGVTYDNQHAFLFRPGVTYSIAF